MRGSAEIVKTEPWQREGLHGVKRNGDEKKLLSAGEKFLFRLPERWRGYFGSIFWQLVLKIKKGDKAEDDKG